MATKRDGTGENPKRDAITQNENLDTGYPLDTNNSVEGNDSAEFNDPNDGGDQNEDNLYSGDLEDEGIKIYSQEARTMRLGKLPPIVCDGFMESLEAAYNIFISEIQERYDTYKRTLEMHDERRLWIQVISRMCYTFRWEHFRSEAYTCNIFQRKLLMRWPSI